MEIIGDLSSIEGSRDKWVVHDCEFVWIDFEI